MHQNFQEEEDFVQISFSYSKTNFNSLQETEIDCLIN